MNSNLKEQINKIDKEIQELNRRKKELLGKKFNNSTNKFKNYALYADDEEYGIVLGEAMLKHLPISGFLKLYIYDFIKDGGKEFINKKNIYSNFSKSKLQRKNVKRLITVSLNQEENMDYIDALEQNGIRNSELMQFIVDKIVYSAYSNEEKAKELKARYNLRPISIEYKRLKNGGVDVIMYMDVDIYNALISYSKVKGLSIENILINKIHDLKGPENFIDVPYGWRYHKNLYDIKTIKFTLSKAETEDLLRKVEGLFCGESKYIRGVIVDIYERMKKI